MEWLMDEVVLDSNIVSYILNGDSRAAYYVERLRGYRQIISFQTLQESRYGASKRGWGVRRKRELDLYLSQYDVYWPDSDLTRISGDLRAEMELMGNRLSVADAWIAATALYLGCPLATHDRDFFDIPNLRLITALA